MSPTPISAVATLVTMAGSAMAQIRRVSKVGEDAAVWLVMKAENLPVKFLRPKTGMMTFVCGFVMHKDTKDAAKAHALIDSNNSEAATAFLVTEMGYGPANTKAMKSIDPAVREKAELPEDVDAFLATGFFQQAIPEKDKLVAMWQEIRALSGR